MIIPTPYEWTDDELVTETLLNANLRDPQLWLMGVPAFLGWNTSATSLTTGTLVAIPIHTEVIKRGFTHSANSSQVTADQSGWYQYTMWGAFTAGTVGNVGFRNVRLTRDGSTRVGGTQTGANSTTTTEFALGGRCGVTWIDSGGVLELFLSQGSGATLATDSAGFTSGRRTGLFVRWMGRDA